ncbi:MAG: serine/threonine protein kinase [Bacteroidetes bacterium]|nr:serine/threonine protein kinase [Bacteroidota bacterium]
MTWLSDSVLERLRRETVWPDLSGTGYRIQSFIASGGMGEVYLVEDTALERRVALKVLAAPLASNDLAERMLREARIVARLEHPGIVPVHDVGRLADGRVFFTMKYVDGERLDRHVTLLEGLPDRLRLFHKVCEAVAFAHSRGVLHRDLKPENIMVGTFGEVLVMDWGIARLLDDAAAAGNASDAGAGARDVAGSGHHTAHGAIMGTPYYMAPEQARGSSGEVDERSDIHALGGILFFLLNGTPPPDPGARAGALHAAVRAYGVWGARALEAICRKAMEERPAARYQSAAFLADDVLRFLDGAAVSAYRENLLERALRWTRRHRFLVLLVLAYLVMRAVVFFLMGR